jgi:hypothetical protein
LVRAGLTGLVFGANLMNVDWRFLARDLAAHLVAAADCEFAERILGDARRDAERLAAPDEFWSAVTAEYERQARNMGADVRDRIRAMLVSFGDR